MKKVLAILCAMALTVSCMAVTAFAADGNLALGATAIADSVNSQYGGDIINLNDDDYATRWQSDKKMLTDGNVQTEENAPWFGLVWDEAQTFNTLVLWFEASNPSTDGFKVFVADNYAEGDTVWTEVTGFNVARDTENCGGNNDSGDDSTDTVTFAEAVTAKAIKVVGYTAENKNDALSVWEIEVFNVAAADEPATIGDGVVKAETAVVDGVKSVFVATNVAEADVPAGASIKASYTITLEDGKIATGEELITAAYTSIALGEAELTAADINGADAADFVTGILFNNVPENATIEVVFTVAE